MCCTSRDLCGLVGITPCFCFFQQSMSTQACFPAFPCIFFLAYCTSFPRSSPSLNYFFHSNIPLVSFRLLMPSPLVPCSSVFNYHGLVCINIDINTSTPQHLNSQKKSLKPRIHNIPAYFVVQLQFPSQSFYTSLISLFFTSRTITNVELKKQQYLSEKKKTTC